MEFGSLGLGTSIPAPNTQSAGANPARSATLETNPENVVTPSTQNDAAENDLRRDGAATPDRPPALATNEPLGSRRTTLNFDTEQNRVFLEVVDTATDEVVERIPSEKFVALVEETVKPPKDIGTPGPEDTDAPV